MKAKDWYAKMFECKTDDDLTKVIGNCLDSLIVDANKLISIRRAKSDKAVAACINEVNNKWIAICNIHESATYEEDHPLYDSKLLKDGFKAAFVYKNPNKGWYFDLTRHRNRTSVMEQREMEKMVMKPALKLFNVTPYEEITTDNITREILETLYLIGHYFGDPSISPTLIMPLVHRVRLLRYWHDTGVINYDDAVEMQKDPYTFFEVRNIPI